ncbi:amidase signature enzyme [Xylaria cf. heliscus]|nr:amidase signature enzyme [Xylaria cf. heliscus]
MLVLWIFQYLYSLVLAPFHQHSHANVSPVSLFAMPPCQGFELEETSISQLQAAYHARRLTTAEVVTCYLERIHQTNGWLNSIQEVNPDAPEIAVALDKERAAGKVRGPLHGIPFVAKDNIATKDKMQTTAGSWMLMGTQVPHDAFVISKLREAGGVLLGSAALTEWAHMRSSNLSEGYSARGGQVRSPYNLTVNPGGSSSGSAAAVAANQCVFSLGTETDGSVIIPAERNALVGLKPTVGLVSRNGVIPETRHQDWDEKGKASRRGYTKAATNKDMLRGARFGIPWDSLWARNSPEQNHQLIEILDRVRARGAEIVNSTELEDHEILVNPSGWDWNWRGKLGFPHESEYTVVKVDFYNDIKSYLSELSNNPIKSVEDIIRYNLDSLGAEGGVPSINPGFLGEQERFHESAATQGVEDEVYLAALSFTQTTSRRGINSASGIGTKNKKPLDALLVPTDFQQAGSVAAQAGYPLITIHAGINSTRTGMPFGLMFMGTAWSEEALIKWANAIEDEIVSVWGKRPMPEWRDYRRRVLPIIEE